MSCSARRIGSLKIGIWQPEFVDRIAAAKRPHAALLRAASINVTMSITGPPLIPIQCAVSNSDGTD